MANESSIGSIGFSSNSISKGFSFNNKNQDDDAGKKMTYAGPNIGNILNGSAQPPTASAAQL